MSKIRKFAEDRVAGSKDLYANRGESRVDKMIDDIVCGTMGEYAVYKLLRAASLPCTKPDLTIYETKKKSFSADLFSGELNIHVKSQTVFSAERYGYSWLCQRSDPLYRQPKEHDIMAFCCVDLEARVVTFLGFVKAFDIKKYDLWSNCKVPMFRRTKIALYLEHFSDYGIVKKELKSE